jgi:hypothetical protein
LDEKRKLTVTPSQSVWPQGCAPSPAIGVPAALHGCSPANQTWWSFGVCVMSSFSARSVTTTPRATVLEGVT